MRLGLPWKGLQPIFSILFFCQLVFDMSTRTGSTLTTSQQIYDIWLDHLSSSQIPSVFQMWLKLPWDRYMNRLICDLGDPTALQTQPLLLNAFVLSSSRSYPGLFVSLGNLSNQQAGTRQTVCNLFSVEKIHHVGTKSSQT